MPQFQFDNPNDALNALLAQLTPVPSESIALHQSTGRILAQPLTADRDSPPHDVSAMDGYAVRHADIIALAKLNPANPTLPISGHVPIGTQPPALTANTALRIYTGSCIPHGADAVIQREHTNEPTEPLSTDQPQRITITVPLNTITPNQNIRRRGENLTQNQTVIPAGTPINHAVAAALASFGSASPTVHQPVHAAALITGDELLPVASTPPPWQIRDSNGPTLHALLANRPYANLTPTQHMQDDLATLTQTIAESLEQHQLLILTGGVSMGQHDHVPQALRNAGATILFHKLPIRPGKPILAAIGPNQQAILALPGNPLSVIAASILFVLPTLRKLAGFTNPLPTHQPATLTNPTNPAKPIPLYWYRPATLSDDDLATPLPSQGSGDTTSAARATGLIELPPNHDITQPATLRFYPYHQP